MQHGRLVLHLFPELQWGQLLVLLSHPLSTVCGTSRLLFQRRRWSIAQCRLRKMQTKNPLSEPTHASRLPALKATCVARPRPAPAPVYRPAPWTRGPFSPPTSPWSAVTPHWADPPGLGRWTSRSRLHKAASACTAEPALPSPLRLSSAPRSLPRSRDQRRIWAPACSSRPSSVTLTAEKGFTPNWAACTQSL